MPTRVFSNSCAAFLLLLCWAGTAPAVLLPTDATVALPGTSVAANPTLAGTVIVDESVPFSFAAYGGTVSGSVQLRVVDAVDGTLDFYWRVFNDPNSAGPIQDFRFGEFTATSYDADFRSDGMGEVAPIFAYRFGPPLEEYVNFYFGELLVPGASSYFFFMDTDAKYYAKTAFYDLTNIGQTQISDLFSMYEPAAAPIPEPASVLLLGTGLLGLAAARRKRGV